MDSPEMLLVDDADVRLMAYRTSSGHASLAISMCCWLSLRCVGYDSSRTSRIANNGELLAI